MNISIKKIRYSKRFEMEKFIFEDMNLLDFILIMDNFKKQLN